METFKVPEDDEIIIFQNQKTWVTSFANAEPDKQEVAKALKILGATNDPRKNCILKRAPYKAIDYWQKGRWVQVCLCCGIIEALARSPRELVERQAAIDEKTGEQWKIMLSPAARLALITC